MSDGLGTLWTRWTRGVVRLWRLPDWDAAAGPEWPSSIMSAVVTDRLHTKQGRSIARWRLGPPGQEVSVYLKRHFRLPVWDGLLAWLRPSCSRSPGAQEWQHLEQARRLGLPVPRALAAGEFIGPAGRLQSFLAVEELEDMLPLHLLIPLAAERLGSREFDLWKRGLIAEMVRLTRILHEANYFHKDLYLCHFYSPQRWAEQSPPLWAGQVFMIDFHRLGRHPLSAWWWRAKDLAQLAYSSEVPGVTLRDRLRFWRLYGGGQHRWLRWAVLTRWRNYRRHNSDG